MSWNYRIIKSKDIDGSNYYQVHEVFYDEDGVANGCTENAITPVGNTVEELKRVFEMILNSFDKPVIEEEYFKEVENE